MFPRTHFIITLILSIVLYPLFKLNVLWFFLSGFLIDFDHYLYYVLKYKTLNFSKAYSYYLKKQDELFLMIFHTIEFWILLLILSSFSMIFIFLLIGLLPHLTMDYIEMISGKDLNKRADSIIQWLIHPQTQSN